MRPDQALNRPQAVPPWVLHHHTDTAPDEFGNETPSPCAVKDAMVVDVIFGLAIGLVKVVQEQSYCHLVKGTVSPDIGL